MPLRRHGDCTIRAALKAATDKRDAVIDRRAMNPLGNEQPEYPKRIPNGNDNADENKGPCGKV